jgi:mannose-6-phosphate isomerase-like protein (cupin superfamily)
MVVTSNQGFEEIRQAMRGGEGSVKMLHVLKKEDLPGKCRLFAKLTMAPGASIGWHDHAGETEFYAILSGQGIVTDQGEEKTVYPGDTVITGNGAGHSIRSVGEDDLVFLAVIVLE